MCNIVEKIFITAFFKKNKDRIDDILSLNDNIKIIMQKNKINDHKSLLQMILCDDKFKSLDQFDQISLLDEYLRSELSFIYSFYKDVLEVKQYLIRYLKRKDIDMYTELVIKGLIMSMNYFIAKILNYTYNNEEYMIRLYEMFLEEKKGIEKLSELHEKNKNIAL